MRFVGLGVLLALLPLLIGIPSCKRVGPPSGTYQINTFQFVVSNPPTNAGNPVPGVWIDTNTTVDLSGGTVTSRLPCAVMIDYTDNDRVFKAAVFTCINVTYDDGTVEASTDAMKLPLRIAAREYESVNSVAGGRIVKTKSSLISGKTPKIITRAEPLRLQMEGHFVKADGGTVAFALDQHFDIKTENSVKPAAEVLQDK